MKRKRKTKMNDDAYMRKKEKQKFKYQKLKEEEKKLKGIVHFCALCNKKTEHRAEGKHWVNYAERCKKCGRVSYSEILRKDYKEDGRP